MTVTDEDRKAAADWCQSQPFSSKQAEASFIRSGEYDHHSLVQAFARHRQAAYAAGLERAAVILEEWGCPLYQRDTDDIATAIRAEKDKT